jgi:putative hemolysin
VCSSGVTADKGEFIVMAGAVILQVILIFLNATFASAEIAVLSMDEKRLKHLASEGDKRAQKLSALTEQPSRFLATIQVAITLAGLLGSAFAAENFADPLVAALVRIGVKIPKSVLKSAAVFVITLILAYFNLVFGELVPKRVAMKKADSMALGMAGLLHGVSKVFAPIVWLLTMSTNLVLRLMRINPEEEEEKVTEEEIRMLLMEGTEQGTIPAEEHEMIQNVFEFNDIEVEEICTHRRDLVWLSLKDDDAVWEQTISESYHTHYPVCGENKDDVIGVLDTKDYFRAADRSREAIMEYGLDRPHFIPETMKANILFRQMKQIRNYFAVILDEYGGLSGIITLHDLMEALVGDLDDEEEPERPEDIVQEEEKHWRIQGCADLEEVQEKLKVKLPTDTYDTFSGFVCGIIGRVPDEGETFLCRYENLEIEVLWVERHIIGECVVTLL